MATAEAHERIFTFHTVSAKGACYKDFCFTAFFAIEFGALCSNRDANAVPGATLPAFNLLARV